MWAGYENMTVVDDQTFLFHDTERGAKWMKALAGGAVWIHGYFKFDWRDTYVELASVSQADLMYNP